MERISKIDFYPNETVIHKTKKHPVSAIICSAKAFLAAMVITIPFILPFAFSIYKNLGLSNIDKLVLAFTIASSLALFFVLACVCFNISITITNKRIIGTIDIFVKKLFFDTSLYDIKSMEVKQGFLGKKFNYGSIVIYTNNGEKEALKVIDPHKVCELINCRGQNI